MAVADPIMALSADEWQAWAARDSLKSFARRMVPGYIGGAHIDRLTDALQDVEAGRLNRLIVTMPPRHSKSLNVSENFPAWYLGRNPGGRIIAASHTAQLAYTFSRRVRNKIADPAYPFTVHVADDKGAVQAWDTNAGGGYIAVGAGGSPTGHGGNGIIIDDPIRSAADAESETVRASLWEWYQGTMRTRLQPGGWIILTATRWHTDDLTGRLLADMEAGGEAWHHIHMPAISDAGEALWPEFWALDDLAKIRQSVGTRVWEAQYQGRPVAQEGGIIKRHWFRFWQHRGQHLPPVPMVDGDGRTVTHPVLELPNLMDDYVQSWDMTFKETTSGSYVVGLTAALKGANTYLVDRVRQRLDFPGTIAAVRAMSERWPETTTKLVEDKANGPAVMDTLRPYMPGLVSVRPDGSKEARMHAASWYVEGGNYVLPHPRIAPWVEEYIHQVTTFPLGAHDDDADATSQLIRRVAQDYGDESDRVLDDVAAWFR